MKIDLNCDLGEGNDFDNQLMPLISSCNIACGGHYGTTKSIAGAVRLAQEHGVKIGAHPSYPDKKNFGRKPMEITKTDLETELAKQIDAVKIEAEKIGKKLHHVKPHGALYNSIVNDWKKAKIVVDVISEIDGSLILFVPPKSVVEKLANGQLKTWKEGFADRKYNPDFSLMSREKKGAVLTQKEAVFEQVFSSVSEGKITASNGQKLAANFDTICVHGDTPNAVDILRYLTVELKKKNIEVN